MARAMSLQFFPAVAFTIGRIECCFSRARFLTANSAEQ